MWVKEIPEGTRLKTAVSNARGQLLIPEGTVLTAKHLKILKIWKIDEVEVENEPLADALLSLDDPRWREREERLGRIFHAGAEPPLDHLRQWAERRMRRELLEGSV